MSAHPVAAGSGNGDAILGVFVPLVNFDQWRGLPSNLWQVTPETARLLQHWRHHDFSGFRPFFCQVEAVETAIWLTEVAPHTGAAGKRVLDHITSANKEANPELTRVALKLATGVGKRVQDLPPFRSGSPAYAS